MQRHLTPRALGRAQWFSDLLTALGEAERLLALLDADGGFPEEAISLKRRIQVVTSELELLNRVARGEGRVVSSSWPEPLQAGSAEA
jgi:hypothetical protein